MLLHEIILPTVDNSGHSCAEALARFELWAVETYGGFTAVDVRGAWLDKGKLYVERNVAYRIAVDNANAAKSATIAKARELFPDQLAFCVAELGHAFIVPVA